MFLSTNFCKKRRTYHNVKIMTEGNGVFEIIPISSICKTETHVNPKIYFSKDRATNECTVA